MARAMAGEVQLEPRRKVDRFGEGRRRAQLQETKRLHTYWKVGGLLRERGGREGTAEAVPGADESDVK